MIYLFTALYCEAHIFIRQFCLEKNLESTQFQEFYNEENGIRLTITGVGEIAAAAAVSSVCTKYQPKASDMLLNVGICAQRAGSTGIIMESDEITTESGRITTESTGIFVCNKITEQTTGKTFYPDILYRHNLSEEAVVTGMTVWNGEAYSVAANGAAFDEQVSDGTLYDMEAAAVYQAGSYFFGPHQMVFLKVVSDKGVSKGVSDKQIENLMEVHQETLVNFIRQLLYIANKNITNKSMQQENCQQYKNSHNNSQQKESSLQHTNIQQDTEALVEKLCIDMHCSKVMRDSLKQHIRYLTLSGSDYAAVIEAMYQEGLLPCNDKREGKLRFEEFKRRLF